MLPTTTTALIEHGGSFFGPGAYLCILISSLPRSHWKFKLIYLSLFRGPHPRKMDNPTREEEPGLFGRPPQQRGPLPSILFIMLMLLLFTSHNGEEFLARHQYQEALQKLTYQKSNFTAWMNGSATNFSLPEQNVSALPLLETLLPSNGSVNPAYSSYYPNITGFIHGDLRLYNITPSFLANSTESYSWKPVIQDYMKDFNDNMTEVSEKMGAWNWSAPQKVAFSVVEKTTLRSANSSTDVAEHVALIHGRIEFSDASIGEDLRLEFEGVHFLKNGTIYGLAEPPNRAVDIRFLPSIVPDNMKNETALLIEPELSSRIEKFKKLIDAGIIEDPLEELPARTACPFTLYAQINSLDVPAHVMKEYEEETQQPSGISTHLPRRLSMKSILISKECGMLYEVLNMEGLRSRTFFRKVTTYAGTAAVAYLTILILLSRQMTRSSTPSGISRVSRYSFLVQSTIDSVSFAGHVTFAVLAEGRPSLSLIAPSFLACVIFLYEAQFSMNIYQIQSPEDTPAPRPPAPVPASPVAAASPVSPPAVAASPVPASTDMNSSNELSNGSPAPPPAALVATTTTPATASPQNVTFWAFFWQQIQSDPQARLYVILFVFLSTIVRIILSPTLTLLFVAMTYSCIWLPQIWRSIKRGRSSGLSMEYLVGITICRLYLMLYFLACPRNVLDVEPRYWSYHLAAFVGLQAIVLMLQEYFGPAFFLPKRFSTVNTYNYHPSLPLPDEESPEKSLGDCAICMDAILLDPSLRQTHEISSADNWDAKASGADGRRKSSSLRGSGGVIDPAGLLDAVQRGVGSAVTRKNYSLAPCHHLFHTECLERWLAIKNICPQCRRPLPPL
ncbi:hypothetical protein J3R30DRAFT_1227234 [Lentinula aciculospora]|uniref:RING-type E3 ubiquitin transferase n=1 Tax=Lentinula aciculospora TaxID=153920 RepID=A0A9W9DGZ8_9AGAR|nr:hypothetical protein J3R30DRAFT_1227234 [Lentinula aciculospora]